MSDKKISDQDYLYLSSLIRAREPQMLSVETMENMIDAPSFDDAAQLLSGHGYKDMSGMGAAQIETELAKHRTDIFRDLTDLVPEKGLIDAFRIRFDYHNAKVLIKAEGAASDGSYLLSDAGRFSPETLKEAYRKDDFSFLPTEFISAIVEAKSVLSRTGNPQLADFVLDKAYFAELIKVSESLSSPFLKSYVGALADAANIKAAVRTIRIHKDIDFLRKALVPGGSRSGELIAQAAMAGDGLKSAFKGTVFEAAAAKGVEASRGGSLTEFELACDNAVIKHLQKAKYVCFGSEVVVVYLAAVEGEITSARMILTGKLSDVKPEKLRERLRDSYA